jgi:hypothetical protein
MSDDCCGPGNDDDTPRGRRFVEVIKRPVEPGDLVTDR